MSLSILVSEDSPDKLSTKSRPSWISNRKKTKTKRSCIFMGYPLLKFGADSTTNNISIQGDSCTQCDRLTDRHADGYRVIAIAKDQQS